MSEEKEKQRKKRYDRILGHWESGRERKKRITITGGKKKAWHIRGDGLNLLKNIFFSLNLQNTKVHILHCKWAHLKSSGKF